MKSTTPSNSRRSPRGSLVGLVVALLLLGLSFYVALNRQQVLDVVHYWTFHPTADVAAIASRATISNDGLFTLYATRSEVDNSSTFNSKCDRKETSTAILGCYTDDRIYVYNVTDSRLDGIREVTMSHEMLHAVYQRLSDDERAQVNALVEAEYKKLEINPDFADRMAFYARTEPGERDNELHSIIGTEVANVSPALEAHYAKYFTDRSKLVSLHDKYNAEFTALDNQTKALGVQLDELSKKIDVSTAQYNSLVKQLNADIANFNRRAASGQFTSQSAFSSERSALQRRVAEVSGMRNAINADVTTYESLRTQYNDTISQSHNLYQSIDSTLAPAPQV